MTTVPLLTTLVFSLLTAAAPRFAVSTQDLYGHRLLLGPGGRPNVALGITSSREQLSISAAGGLSAIGRREPGGELVEVALGPSAIARRVGGREAELSYAVAVATLEGADRSRREQVLRSWRALGEESVHAREVGLVFGILGTVVDNRATLVLARPSSSSVRCERAARALHQAHGVTTRVVPLMRRLPELTVKLEGGDVSATFVGTVTLRDLGGGPVTVRGVESETGKGRAGGYQRSYSGVIALAPDRSGRIAAVNVTTPDEVLKGVVPSEMFATAPLEALKAQAVTARGAIFAKLGRRHFADPLTLCNQQHCQVYRGIGASHPNASRAVEETRGELAFLAGGLVDSVYSSTCGGHTEDAEVVWDTAPKAALRGRPDVAGASQALARRLRPFEHGGLGDESDAAATDLRDEAALRAYLSRPPTSYCARASMVRADKLRWQRRITSRDMDRLLFPHGVGHVRRVEVLGRGVSGRVRALKFVGDRKEAIIQREWPVRQALGLLNSGAFVIDVERGAGEEVTAFLFRGMGWGHGVGMCQVGAIGMAEAGHDYRAILRHYYNGAEVKRVY